MVISVTLGLMVLPHFNTGALEVTFGPFRAPYAKQAALPPPALAQMLSKAAMRIVSKVYRIMLSKATFALLSKETLTLASRATMTT